MLDLRMQLVPPLEMSTQEKTIMGPKTMNCLAQQGMIILKTQKGLFLKIIY